LCRLWRFVNRPVQVPVQVVQQLVPVVALEQVQALVRPVREQALAREQAQAQVSLVPVV